MKAGILRNSSILIVAQAITRLISFIYTIFLARSLGVETFGLYSVAIAYFSLLAAVSDFGISRFLMREVALGKNVSLILTNVLILRLTTLSIISILFILILFVLDHSLARRSLSLLAIIAIIPHSIALTFDNILIAFQKVSKSAIGLLILNLATTILGVSLIILGYGAIGALIALILGYLIYSGFLFALLKPKFSLKISVNEIKKIISSSLPYGILAIMGLLYFKIDTILLSYLKGSFDTGIYAAAYKFLEALVFIPASLALVLFPILTKLHRDKEEIKKIYFQIIKIMGFIGILAGVGFILFLPIIIKLFLPSYLLSINSLQILALSIPFLFIYVPLSQILLSDNKFLKLVILFSLIPLLFNISLNFIFIPQYGYLAASWITVVSDVVSLAITCLLIQKYYFKI